MALWPLVVITKVKNGFTAVLIRFASLLLFRHSSFDLGLTAWNVTFGACAINNALRCRSNRTKSCECVMVIYVRTYEYVQFKLVQHDTIIIWHKTLTVLHCTFNPKTRKYQYVRNTNYVKHRLIRLFLTPFIRVETISRFFFITGPYTKLGTRAWITFASYVCKIWTKSRYILWIGL